jgi:hypothetical protein
MATIISRQTFKALCNPLLRPLHRFPGKTPRLFSSHHKRSMEVPFSGPPSYDTLARRFSSYPTPVNLYALQSWQKVKGPSEYVDIHELRDISDLDPKAFDVLITDVNEEILQTEISKVFGIDYLAKATEDDAKR